MRWLAWIACAVLLCGLTSSITRANQHPKVVTHTVTQTKVQVETRDVPGPTKTITNTVTKLLPVDCYKLPAQLSAMIDSQVVVSNLADKLKIQMEALESATGDKSKIEKAINDLDSQIGIAVTTNMGNLPDYQDEAKSCQSR